MGSFCRINSSATGLLKKESVELISLFDTRFWNTYTTINNTPHQYWGGVATNMPIHSEMSELLSLW